MPRPPLATVSTLVSDANIISTKPYGALDPTNTYVYAINNAKNGINIINLSNGSYTTYSLYNSTGTSILTISQTEGVCMDSTGAFFFADYLGHTVYKVVLSNGKYCATAVIPSSVIKYPNALCADSANNIYVGDSGNRRIIMVSPSNYSSIVYTIGDGTSPGSVGLRDGNWSASVNFSNTINGIAIDAAGNLYVTDNGTYRVRKLQKYSSDYYVTTIGGGSGATISSGYADGLGSLSRYGGLTGIAIDPSGNVYVSDFNNGRVCMLVPNSDFSVYTTYSVAGAYTTTLNAGVTTYTAVLGYTDGTGPNASLNRPMGIFRTPSGFVYTMDGGGEPFYGAGTYNPTIRRMTIS
jgi:sugar lactone lactonase YvrE